MPNEIDVKGLREKVTSVRYLNEVSAFQLIEEVERLRGYPSTAAREETDQRASDALAAAFRQRDAAETELSALKEKMEKVREEVNSWMPWCPDSDTLRDDPQWKFHEHMCERLARWQDSVLAILDGKEG